MGRRGLKRLRIVLAQIPRGLIVARTRSAFADLQFVEESSRPPDRKIPPSARRRSRVSPLAAIYAPYGSGERSGWCSRCQRDMIRSPATRSPPVRAEFTGDT